MNQALEDFCSSLQGKTVAVVGVGVSNAPLCELFWENGARVTACDRRERAELGEIADSLEAKGIELKLGGDYLKGLTQELIIKTPGMRPDLPELLEAAARGSVITSEMELFFELCPCEIIAVTGSDGKSTTTALIHEILKAAGHRCHLGGNIGFPLLPRIREIGAEDLVVAELSSFQLQTMRRSPKTAVITNIAPNHLDVHKSMEEYVEAKKNILRYQDASGLLVVNRDNALSRQAGREARGRLLEFSSSQAVENGAYYLNDTVWLARDGKAEPVLRREEILLPGRHNVENYMAALLATSDYAAPETVRRVAGTFKGLKHRQELVRELDGVRYYNDSIASSPTRTAAIFQSFPQKLILIAGGYDKKIPFDQFGEAAVKHVKLLLLIGNTAPKIREAVERAPGYRESGLSIVDCAGLEEAVHTAREQAHPGDIVALSPACASFDMFPNFEARGEAFRRLVEQL